MSLLDVICDNAHQDLDQVPALTMQMSNLKMLYLESNRLTSLPEDFFYRLPLLNWLDLRNNQLTAIPASIEFHSFLENMLLQNNRITRLPNELGVVPNLKVLQLTGNPIQYPCQDVIENGVDDICAFLKIKYDKERLGQNYGIYLKDPVIIKPKCSTTSNCTKSTETKPSVEDIRRTLRKRLSKTRTSKNPILTVKSLSKLHQEQQLKGQDSLEEITNLKHDNSSNSTESEEVVQKSYKLKTGKNGKDSSPSQFKVHKIVSERSKLSVRSHYSNKYQSKYVNSSKDCGVVDFGEDRLHGKRVQGQQLKDLWLAKLKDLLQDQQKIIQQERNLNVLNNWRQEKHREPNRDNNDYDPDKLLEDAPYDIDPEYSRIPSRSDLTKQLDKLVRRGVDGKKKLPRNIDVQRLINDLIKQLQEIETSSTLQTREAEITPRKKLESTEKEIKMIMDLHKKITELQGQNKV